MIADELCDVSDEKSGGAENLLDSPFVTSRSRRRKIVRCAAGTLYNLANLLYHFAKAEWYKRYIVRHSLIHRYLGATSK